MQDTYLYILLNQELSIMALFLIVGMLILTKSYRKPILKSFSIIFGGVIIIMSAYSTHYVNSNSDTLIQEIVITEVLKKGALLKIRSSAGEFKTVSVNKDAMFRAGGTAIIKMKYLMGKELVFRNIFICNPVSKCVMVDGKQIVKQTLTII